MLNRLDSYSDGLYMLKIKIINKIARSIVEAVYYNAIPSYKTVEVDPYTDLSVKFPKLKNSFLPHVMFPTEVDKNRSRIGTHYVFLFFKTFVQTIQLYNEMFADLSPVEIVWSEKKLENATSLRSLIVEHGWLPRSSYQISFSGANGRAAPPNLMGGGEYIEIIGGKSSLISRLDILKKGFLSKKPVKINFESDEEFVVVPLQMGNDLNLRDSSTKFSEHYGKYDSTSLLVADLVDTINSYDLPFPIYFTQHPVDHREHNVYLRKCDRFVRANSGISTMDLIRHVNCRGIISINSNVVHEALCLNVPCCVLGRLFWRDDQHSPFMSDPVTFFNNPSTYPHNCPQVLEYLAKLFCYQWFLSDFQNPLIVKEIISKSETIIPFQIRQKYSV